MAPTNQASDEDKGEPIKFVKGGYVGEAGWMHTDKGFTAKMAYVVVEKSEKVPYTKWTRVKKTSIVLLSDYEEPESFEEALLDQHPDIDAALDKVVAEIVKCKLSNILGDSDEIVRIFFTNSRMRNAINVPKATKLCGGLLSGRLKHKQQHNLSLIQKSSLVQKSYLRKK